MDGWIKLHRTLTMHELWTAEPFTRGQAWVDLLLLANHRPGHIRKRGILVEVERGQCNCKQKENCMKLVEKQEMLRWEDVPVLLCAILQELRIMNGKPKMPVEKDVVIEPKTVEAEKPKTEKKETENAETSITHDEVKELCLDLNRKDPANKDKIMAIIADFTDGKLADVPSDKLEALKSRIDALNG